VTGSDPMCSISSASTGSTSPEPCLIARHGWSVSTGAPPLGGRSCPTSATHRVIQASAEPAVAARLLGSGADLRDRRLSGFRKSASAGSNGSPPCEAPLVLDEAGEVLAALCGIEMLGAEDLL